ncbi:MAG: sigma 54-interacting transcriptional regulator [Mogibacterium sp.]|nr:sigma 54-interacting transcriptional regulator [Mogibacterium sp.]
MSNNGKIAYIVPSEVLLQSAERILQEEIREGVLDAMMIDVRNVRQEYERLYREGYICLIARGGTYFELKKCSEVIPVLQERIRTSDILEMLAAREAGRDEPVYIVLHRGTAPGFENITAVTDGRMKVLRYELLEELSEVLAGIPESGVRVYTSGYATLVSDRTDLRFIELRNRPHTIRETVNLARNFLGQMQENIQRVNLMNSIYDNIDEGLVIFRSDNVIMEVNRRAAELIGMDREEMIGREIYSIIQEMPERRPDGHCSIDSPRTFTGRVGRTRISYTVYPFEFYQDETRYMMTLQDVTKIQELEHNIRLQLSKKGLVAEHTLRDILTCEPVMEHIIDKAGVIAGYEGSVLIYGESGTGKELFAQGIHNASRRSSGPFVAINCAALTESLLESELFGYVGGSFTGARKEGKAGLFELAHRGTIFLDEINSTPLSLQAKILRVIESQQVMRVGSDYVIPLDVRIISASNGNLERDIDEGRFRRDLYYRLNTFELTIPPIRERKQDILLLFRYYLSRFAERTGGVSADEIQLDPAFERQLLRHTWLGNVREIRSVALRYDAFSGDNLHGDILKPDDGSATAAAAGQPAAQTAAEAPGLLDSEQIPLSGLTDAVEHLVIQALENRGLTRTEIASALGISRQALYKKMKKDES